MTVETPARCATHPDVETDLGCNRCGKGICPRCLVYTPIGARCRECANVRRIPTYAISGGVLVRAIAGALIAGSIVGTAWFIFNAFTFIFFGVVVGLAVGFGVGEIVSVATNRKAGPPLQAAAVSGVALAYLVRVGLLFAVDSWVFEDLRLDFPGLVALGVAAFIAAGRVR